MMRGEGFLREVIEGIIEGKTKFSLQRHKLTKPVRLTDVTCAFIKINGVIWCKLRGIISIIH